MTQPTNHRFEIRVSGWLAEHWAVRFDGMKLRQTDGDTVLEGEVPDQSALFGVLHTIENLGLTVISVRTFPNGI
jgi:hypothetical protein